MLLETISFDQSEYIHIHKYLTHTNINDKPVNQSSPHSHNFLKSICDTNYHFIDVQNDYTLQYNTTLTMVRFSET